MEPLRIFYSEPPLDNDEIALHALGIREWMPAQMINRPSGTGDYLFMHFHQETVIGVPSGAQPFPAHTLMVWGPLDGHLYGQTAAKWCHSWMHVEGRAVARALDAAGVPLATPITGVDPRILEGCVSLIHGEVRRNARADEVIVANLLDILAREIGRVANARGAPSVPSRWLDLRRHLEECFAEPMRLKDLAKRAGCSVPHFCAEFKRHFRCSAIEFVIRQRMHRARMLLRNRNTTVTDVAEAVGYDDIHHFSKLFRKHHGMPPSEMREMLVAG